MKNDKSKLLQVFVAALLLLFLALIPTNLVRAQDAQTSPNAERNSAQPNVTQTVKSISAEDIPGWNIELDQMSKALAREGIRDTDFDKINIDAQKILADAEKLTIALSPELKTLKDRINQLGPAPTNEQPAEQEAITTERSNLSDEISKIDGAIKSARIVILKSRQIRDGITKTRRARFVSAVTSKSHTIFDSRLWQPFRQDAGFFSKGLPKLLSNIATSIVANLQKSGVQIFLVFGSLVVWFLVLLLASRGLNRLKKTAARVETDRSLVALNAFLNVLTSGAVPGLAIMGFVWVLDGFGLLNAIHTPFITGTAFAIAIALIITALARAFIAPGSPGLRISSLSDKAARHLTTLIDISMVLFVISWLVYDAGIAMAASLQFGIAVKALFAIAIAFIAVLTLRIIRHDQQDDAQADATQGLSVFLNWNLLRFFGWSGILLIILSLLIGYIALADFAANQIILTSAVLAILWLLLKIIDDNIVGCFQTGHEINRSISYALGWKYRFTEQVGVVTTGLARLAAILLAILVLLIPWGYRASDWVDWISAAFFGFRVGDITISFSVILSAIVVFALGVLVTRAIQKWLSNRMLPTTRLDAGIRNSISTVFGYIGISVAAMITISFAGFDLSSLAIVAGALSVGIGFGLQSVVSNFVSGLILLAERPIKAGDWVITSGGEGTVRKISVRSTEIETFDRATVIVPNATLITDSVVNWNHRSSMGRIKLAIGVGYESNPERVREILLECVKENDGILDNPAPIVYFMEFGASSLDFELRCFLADVGNGMGVKSNLRFAIFAALNKEGISIPFPQQDVHIKGFAPETSQPEAVKWTPSKVSGKNIKHPKDGLSADEE